MRLASFLTACFLVLWSSVLVAVPVTSIVVTGAARDTQISEIRRALGFAEGDAFDESLINLAKKRIENAAILHSVDITSLETAAGVEVTVQVELEPLLSELSLDVSPNLLPISNSRLSLLKGEYCSEAEIKKAIQEIKDAAVKLGFLKADIDYTLTRNTKSEWLLRVAAKENEPTRIATLKINADNARMALEIRNALGVSEGSLFKVEEVRGALKTWKESKLAKSYFDASARLEKEVYNKVTNSVDIVIEASLGEAYKIHFDGVAYFSARFLRQDLTRLLLKLEPGASRKQRMSIHLHTLYKRHGFRDAKIEIGDDLYVQIKEGHQYLVSEVFVKGVSDDDAEDIMLRFKRIVNDLYKSESINDSPLVAANGFLVFDERSVNKAKAQIQDELYQKGFLNSKISGPKIKVDAKTHFATLTLNAALGPRAHVTSIDIDAFGIPSTDSFLKCIDFKVGDSFMLSKLEAPRSCMEEDLWNNGYPYAQVLNETILSAENTVAQVKFRVRAGPYVKIGGIAMRGLVTTRASTLAARVAVVAGEPYSLQNVVLTRQALFNSDFVDRVDIFTEPSGIDEETRTLIIDVHEKARTSIELGAGISLEDGPRVSLLMTQRNLFGLGMGFKGRMQLNYPAIFYKLPFLYTEKYQKALESIFKEESPFMRALLYTEAKLSLSLDYPFIGTAPWDTDATAGLTLNRELKVAYTLNRIGIETALAMKPFANLHFGPVAQYEFAKFFCPSGHREGIGCDNGDVADPLTRRIDSGVTQQFTFRLLGSLDGRDSVLRPKNGYFFDATMDLGVGGADLGSEDTSSYRPIRYLKLQANANVFRPLSKSATWHLAMKVGHIFGLADDHYVPPFKKFYLGGTNTIRGFAEDEILPADDAKRPADSLSPEGPTPLAISHGGNFFALMRAEIRFPFSDEHDGAVFIDTGELLNNAGNFSLGSLAVGAGFGIRYLTPIGPLMLDLGIRIVDGVRAYNSGFWQLFGIHFSIGYF